MASRWYAISIDPGCGCCSYVTCGVRDTEAEIRAAFPGPGYEYEEDTEDD